MKKESFSLNLPEIKTILLLKNNYPKAIECLKEKIQERDKIKIDSIYYSVIKEI